MEGVREGVEGDLRQVQVGREGFDHALEVEEVVRGRLDALRVVPRGGAPPAAQHDAQRPRLVREPLPGPRHVDRTQLEQGHGIDGLEVPRRDLQHPGGQLRPHHRPLGADRVHEDDVLGRSPRDGGVRTQPRLRLRARQRVRDDLLQPLVGEQVADLLLQFQRPVAALLGQRLGQERLRELVVPGNAGQLLH